MYTTCLQRFFSFHRYSSFVAFSECVPLVVEASSLANVNFENPVVVESSRVETYVNVFKNLAKSTPVVKDMRKE